MASKLKRVSEETERIVNDIATREGRTFIAQLDRLVEAGLDALGYQTHTDARETVPPSPARGDQ